MTEAKQRVLGLGGLFVRSRDPDALTQWYENHLGVSHASAANGWEPWQQAAGPTVFQPFAPDSTYFGSLQQTWMLNFRVGNLDAFVAQLQAAGIEVAVDPENYPHGRFARLHDPDGNPIELWEEPAE